MRVETVEYSDEIIKEIAKLRVDAYENDALINQCTFPRGWMDELDATGTHIVVKDGDRIVGSSRLNELDTIFDIPWLSGLAGSVESKKRVVYLSRLVVHPSYKRRGIGLLLDDQGYRLAKELGVACIYVVAKSWRLDYLLARGFVRVHDIKTVQTINGVSHLEEKCLLCREIVYSCR